MKHFLIALMFFGLNSTAMASNTNPDPEMKADGHSTDEGTRPNLPLPEEVLRPTDPCLTNDEGRRILLLIEATANQAAGELPKINSARMREANTRKNPPNYLPHING